MTTGWWLGKQADAEQAKSTGGMVALYPRSDFTDMLTVSGGEAPDDLHVTLVYAGEDVSGMPVDSLANAVEQVAQHYTAITSRVFGHAIFNPDEDPCGVYLLGNSPELAQLHDEIEEVASGVVDLPDQHSPWIPHITCSYGSPPTIGQFIGDVVFDRLGIAWAGQTEFFPLVGSTVTASWGISTYSPREIYL